MVSKRKGFTLVELLAVIVIFAIILAISIPTITGIIDNATKNAFVSDTKMLIKVIEYKLLEDEGYNIEYIDKDKVYNDLKLPNDNYGDVSVEKDADGNIYLTIEGTGKWAGLIACGTYQNMVVGDGSECGAPLGGAFACGDTLIDLRDNEEYATIQIGEQCWMADNLKYTGSGCLSNAWNDSSPYNACRFNNPEPAWGPEVLYQWGAAMNGSTIEGDQGLCPEGWHIPTDNEIKILEMHLGMTQVDVDETLWRGTNQGDQLKGSSPSWCSNGVYCATSGFNMTPAGGRNISGLLGNVATHGYWWSSTLEDSYVWRRFVYADYATVYRSSYIPARGSSVRCLRGQ
jgi:uncharacterized protein (TIGR02145 family)/prepilin-type N-terminal cleavage/methylation domain-containing protein